jgi:hypothetical protein
MGSLSEAIISGGRPCKTEVDRHSEDLKAAGGEIMGVLIDLRDELRVRHLARMLVEDLGLDIHDLQGEPIDFAKDLMSRVDDLPEGHGESIEEDHPELFELLRKTRHEAVG